MRNTFKILLIILALISTRCLNDNTVPIDNIVLDETAEILRYLESTGDFANTELAPAIIYAQELFANKEQFFILDIREPLDYSIGHIEGSINIPITNLYEIVDSLYIINPSKSVAIVSQNGQASSYFTCLLRLAGFNNVYTLNFGMASWNMFFADEWFGALDTVSQLFTNIEFPKRPFTHLPKLEFPSSVKTIQEKTIFRIKEIIDKGFINGTNYSENLSTGIANTHLLICYGEARLYNEFAPGGKGHPENAVWFKNATLFEFRSVNSLQTLPNDQPILIYSGDGQLSACMAAYLTVLGYNVKTLLFGANQLFYSRLDSEPTLTKYIFSSQVIMNFPYVSGN
jgi:rhodanese-related sulfurtransferase